MEFLKIILSVKIEITYTLILHQCIQIKIIIHFKGLYLSVFIAVG